MLVKNVCVLKMDQIPDSVGEVFDPSGVVLAEGTVPVTLGFSRELQDQLGYATLRRAGNEVLATLYLYDGLPHMPATHELLSLTPAVGGQCNRKEQVINAAGTRGSIIRSARIDGIGLSCGRNADKRICSLREQITSAAFDTEDGGVVFVAGGDEKASDEDFAAAVAAKRVVSPDLPIEVIRVPRMHNAGLISAQDVAESFAAMRSFDDVSLTSRPYDATTDTIKVQVPLWFYNINLPRRALFEQLVGWAGPFIKIVKRFFGNVVYAVGAMFR